MNRKRPLDLERIVLPVPFFEIAKPSGVDGLVYRGSRVGLGVVKLQLLLVSIIKNDPYGLGVAVHRD